MLLLLRTEMIHGLQGRYENDILRKALLQVTCSSIVISITFDYVSGRYMSSNLRK